MIYALKLTDLWNAIASLLFDLSYKFELTGASLLALAKSIYAGWTEGCSHLSATQGAEELFVMASEAKILQPIGRVVFVYRRIDCELDLSNSLAMVLQTW